MNAMHRFQDWAKDTIEQPPPFRPLFGHWTDALREQRDQDLPAIVTAEAQYRAVLRDVSLADCVASQRSCFTARVRQFLDEPFMQANPGAGSVWPFLIAGYVSGLVIYDGHSRLTAATLRGVTAVRCLVLVAT